MNPKKTWFGINPPPGFRGLDPHAPIESYHRHLPHWRQRRATYAVTFRQQDSLPKHKLEELKQLRREWESEHAEPRDEKSWQEFAKEYSRRTDAWLDEGYGSCRFSSLENATILSDALRRFHGKRYHTGAFAIMPNHCHLLIRPFDVEDLELLLKGIKGSVSRAVLKHENQTDKNLWQQESHDRIVRDPAHLAHAIRYIGDNPGKAGLEHEKEWRCWIAEDWIEAGWGFEAFEEE